MVAESAQAGRGTLEREITIKDPVGKKRLFWGERMGTGAGWTIMTSLEELTRASTWPVKRGRTMSRTGNQVMMDADADSFRHLGEPGLQSSYPLNISLGSWDSALSCKSSPYQAW
jgi:hypothetical protein